jgi:hypothetical protein
MSLYALKTIEFILKRLFMSLIIHFYEIQQVAG